MQSDSTVAFLIICSAMVLFMTPGLAFFYGGLVRASSVVSMMMMSFGSVGLVGTLWVVYGYAMSFASSSNAGFIGVDGVFGQSRLSGNTAGGKPKRRNPIGAIYNREISAGCGGKRLGIFAKEFLDFPRTGSQRSVACAIAPTHECQKSRSAKVRRDIHYFHRLRGSFRLRATHLDSLRRYPRPIGQKNRRPDRQPRRKRFVGVGGLFCFLF